MKHDANKSINNIQSLIDRAMLSKNERDAYNTDLNVLRQVLKEFIMLRKKENNAS